MSQEVVGKTGPELQNEFVGLFYENLGPALEDVLDGEWYVSKYPGSVTIAGSLNAVDVFATWFYEKGEVEITTKRSFKTLVVTTTHRTVAKSLTDVVSAVIKAIVSPNENVDAISIEAFVE
ncbi:MAG: hypothetical protein RQ842_10120 [Vulcanisaeta sp.]|jgi:hypothetical protein|nr:hypothetical protein [Vulcanisaeta sp.]